MAEFVAAATGVGLALKALKTAIDLAGSIKDRGGNELKKALAAVQDQLLTVQRLALEQGREHQGLLEECRELRVRLDRRERLQEHKNMYWLGPHDERNGPYCIGCFNKDESRVLAECSRTVVCTTAQAVDWY